MDIEREQIDRLPDRRADAFREASSEDRRYAHEQAKQRRREQIERELGERREGSPELPLRPERLKELLREEQKAPQPPIDPFHGPEPLTMSRILKAYDEASARLQKRGRGRRGYM